MKVCAICAGTWTTPNADYRLLDWTMLRVKVIQSPPLRSQFLARSVPGGSTRPSSGRVWLPNRHRVSHPEHAGGYLLGVECDGFMYHSSRAARDRDRLREQVLRRLGWTLHRIWGTAWYRNRQGEEARLRAAIDSALTRPIQGLMVSAEATDDEIVRAVVEVETVRLDAKPIWAVPYQVAQVPPLPRWCDPSSTDSRRFMIPAVTEVARVEGPVHMSLIHQRLRDAWNIGRVGSIIRKNIDVAIYRAEVSRQGDFIMIPSSGIRVRTPTPDCSGRLIRSLTTSSLPRCTAIFATRSGSTKTSSRRALLVCSDGIDEATGFRDALTISCRDSSIWATCSATAMVYQ